MNEALKILVFLKKNRNFTAWNKMIRSNSNCFFLFLLIKKIVNVYCYIADERLVELLIFTNIARLSMIVFVLKWSLFLDFLISLFHRTLINPRHIIFVHSYHNQWEMYVLRPIESRTIHLQHQKIDYYKSALVHVTPCRSSLPWSFLFNFLLIL